MEKICSNTLVDPNTNCWVWQRSVTSAGYGQITVDGKYWTTHRYVYTKVYGEIQDNLIVRHMCHNTRCCNPFHLVLGTHTDNYADSLVLHREANERRRKEWVVDGVKYGTCRDVVNTLGMSFGTITKHTHNGVFDVEAYRRACFIARVEPKI